MHHCHDDPVICLLDGGNVICFPYVKECKGEVVSVIERVLNHSSGNTLVPPPDHSPVASCPSK